MHTLRRRWCRLWWKPVQIVLVEERPRRHNHEKCESCTSQTNVESAVDVLREEANQECDCADEGEEAICDVFDESLSFEVL